MAASNVQLLFDQTKRMALIRCEKQKQPVNLILCKSEKILMQRVTCHQISSEELLNVFLNFNSTPLSFTNF